MDVLTVLRTVANVTPDLSVAEALAIADRVGLRSWSETFDRVTALARTIPGLMDGTRITAVKQLREADGKQEQLKVYVDVVKAMQE